MVEAFELSSLQAQPVQPVQPAPDVRVGGDLPAGWLRVADLPLLVLVGLTASGKSTILETLVAAGVRHTLLPGRRVLTDQVIIAPLQRQAGAPVHLLGRYDRFPYVRRFLEAYPGGMGEILSWIFVSPETPLPLVFESLRGVNEVTAAAARLPRARFVVLHAPSMVRLQRLLGRADPHDRIGASFPGGAAAGARVPTFATLGIPEARSLFDADQERWLCSRAASGEIQQRPLLDALSILVAERSMYDLEATSARLLDAVPDQTLVLDTTVLSPDAAAAACIAWMNHE